MTWIRYDRRRRRQIHFDQRTFLFPPIILLLLLLLLLFLLLSFLFSKIPNYYLFQNQNNWCRHTDGIYYAQEKAVVWNVFLLIAWYFFWLFEHGYRWLLLSLSNCFLWVWGPFADGGCCCCTVYGVAVQYPAEFCLLWSDDAPRMQIARVISVKRNQNRSTFYWLLPPRLPTLFS